MLSARYRDGVATASHNPTHLTIICPMQYELSLLQAEGVGDFATLHCCGGGGDAVTKVVAELSDTRSPVVLAGVGGGISPRAVAGHSYMVTQVRNINGNEQLEPPISTIPVVETEPCVACHVDQPVTTPKAKRELHEQTGADVVDLESLPFARACAGRGLRWGIIRGISDGPEEELPEELLTCVDEHGRALKGRAALLTVRKPTLIPAMMRLRQHSTASMKRAAELLRMLHDASESQ